MWTTLTPAIIGFVGVLVGSLISTGANYLLAVRKEKADATKDRLSRSNELRTAARLIAGELFNAQTAATILVEKNVGWLRQFNSHWTRGREIKESSPANYRLKIGMRSG
jgi:hypothetical protein